MVENMTILSNPSYNFNLRIKTFYKYLQNLEKMSQSLLNLLNATLHCFIGKVRYMKIAKDKTKQKTQTNKNYKIGKICTED